MMFFLRFATCSSEVIDELFYFLFFNLFGYCALFRFRLRSDYFALVAAHYCSFLRSSLLS